MTLTDGHRRALHAEAWRLLREPGARPRSADRAATLTWLRVRAAQGRRSFFRPRYDGEGAVARAWTRVHDLAGPRDPVTLALPFPGDPLPWPTADAGGVGVTLTDLPVPDPGAVGAVRVAREVLDGAHLVLAVAPHAALAGREPLPPLFRTLLTDTVAGACPPPAVLVSALAALPVGGSMEGLSGWLRGTVPTTVGPAVRHLPVHTVVPPLAARALRVLARPQDRDTPAVVRARTAWAACGLPDLCSAVLVPALRRAGPTVRDLSARRLRTALHDIRLDLRPSDAGDGGTPSAARLWDDLDAFAATALARRAARRYDATALAQRAARRYDATFPTGRLADPAAPAARPDAPAVPAARLDDPADPAAPPGRPADPAVPPGRVDDLAVPQGRSDGPDTDRPDEPRGATGP
ncbi:MAG: hypothetical protein H5T76_13885 [Streptomyces sp.]|nr:hypothetical protein [Streptomyces sp.]